MNFGTYMRNSRFFQKKILLGKNFRFFFDPINIFSDDVYKSKTFYLGVIECFKLIGAIRFNLGDY